MRISFSKRATNCRALLRKMTYEDKASYVSSPPCITPTRQNSKQAKTNRQTRAHPYAHASTQPTCAGWRDAQRPARVQSTSVCTGQAFDEASHFDLFQPKKGCAVPCLLKFKNVSIYMYMHVCVNICIMCVSVWMHVCVNASVCVCVCTCLSNAFVCVCEYACEISLGPLAEDIGLFCAKYMRQLAYQHGCLQSNPTGLE